VLTAKVRRYLPLYTVLAAGCRAVLKIVNDATALHCVTRLIARISRYEMAQAVVGFISRAAAYRR